MAKMNNPLLSQLHVLVTRPIESGRILCDDIKRLGGDTTLFPTLEIYEPDDSASLKLAVATINNFDLALFISPSAVRKTAEHIKLSKLALDVISLGSATTSALEEKGCVVSIKPEGHDSEALLRLPQLQKEQIKDKRFIIFKGEGGRNLISDSLIDRGAEVFEANMYRRRLPADYTPLTSKTLHNIDVILVSSGESLNNLVEMTESKDELLGIKILVPGKRCKNIAFDLGFSSVIETTNATNAAFIEKLQELI